MNNWWFFAMGVIIGCIIEWVVWVIRCYKFNLFKENVKLKELRKK